MKYISLDIETTGLDPKVADILEVVAVFEDTDNRTPVEEKMRLGEVFRFVNIQDSYKTDAFCAKLHSRLWDEINGLIKEAADNETDRWSSCSADKDSEPSAIAHNYYRQRITYGGEVILKEGLLDERVMSRTLYGPIFGFASCFRDWLAGLDMPEDAARGNSITVAGKNVASFDLPFLRHHCREFNNVRIKHRVIDPAVYFVDWKTDTELPDTATCMSRAGLELTDHHTALGDALDVVRLMRVVCLR